MRSPRGILQPPGLRLAHDVSPLLFPGSAGVGQPNPTGRKPNPGAARAQRGAGRLKRQQTPVPGAPSAPFPAQRKEMRVEGRTLHGPLHRYRQGRRNRAEPPRTGKEGGGSRTLCTLPGRGAEGTLPPGTGPRERPREGPSPCAGAAPSAPGPALRRRHGERSGEPGGLVLPPRSRASDRAGPRHRAPLASTRLRGIPNGHRPRSALADSPQGPLQPNRAPLPPPPPPQRARRRHFVYLPPPPGPAALPPLPPPGPCASLATDVRADWLPRRPRPRELVL